MYNTQTIDVSKVQPGEFFLLVENNGDNQSIAVMHRNSQDPNVFVYDAIVNTIAGETTVYLAENKEEDIKSCSVRMSADGAILPIHHLGEESEIELSGASAVDYMNNELKASLIEHSELDAEKLLSFGRFLFATHGGNAGYEWLRTMSGALKERDEVRPEDVKVG